MVKFIGMHDLIQSTSSHVENSLCVISPPVCPTCKTQVMIFNFIFFEPFVIPKAKTSSSPTTKTTLPSK